MSPDDSSDFIVRASPGLRRATLILVVVIGVIGFLTLIQVQGTRERIAAGKRLNNAEVAALTGWFRVACWSMAGLTVLIGIYLKVLSVRTWRAERFPPPGVRVVRDTRIRVGRAARSLAALAGILGWIIACLGIGIGIVGTILATMLGG